MMATLAGAVVSAQGDDTVNGKRGGRGGFGGFSGHSEVVLEATGLTSEELRTALQDGSTIADLITANDGDIDSVIEELVAETTTQINERVEAGRMTQEQADEALANIEDTITARLDGTYERPEGDAVEGRRGRGGRGKHGFGDDTDDITTEAPADTSDDA